jgi:putative endonuclease
MTMWGTCSGEGWQHSKTCHPGRSAAESRDPGAEEKVQDHCYFVYILASQRNGTLYVGVTNDLIRRVQEHREGLVEGFTRRYRVKLLVFYEGHQDIREAITREKRIKRWRRDWKLQLIERSNPRWRDLWLDLTKLGE